MHATNSLLRKAFACLIALQIAAAACFNCAAAQSLAGQELTPVNETETSVSSWLSRKIAGESRPSGDIQGARVVADEADAISLEVRFTGFSGYELLGEIVDAEGGAIPGISHPTASVAASPAVMAFTFNSDNVEAAHTSAFVVIQIVRPGRTSVLSSKAFALPKVWRGAILVRPTPIGKAIELKARFGDAAPGGGEGQRFAASPLLLAAYSPGADAAATPASFAPAAPPPSFAPAIALAQVGAAKFKTQVYSAPIVKLQLAPPALPSTATKQIFALKARNNKYLVAEAGGGKSLSAQSDSIQTWERFSIVDRNGGALQSGDEVHLLASDGKSYVRPDGTNPTAADAAGPYPYTQMVIESGPAGAAIASGASVRLRTSAGGYLGAAANGAVSAQFGADDPAVRFAVEAPTIFYTMAVRTAVSKDPALLMSNASVAEQVRAKSEVRGKTKDAITALPYDRRMIKVRPDLVLAVDETATPKEAPDVDLQSAVAVEPSISDFKFWDQFPLFGQLFSDKEPNSRRYYYLPRSYNVDWSQEDSRAGFHIIYQAASGEDSAGQVQMAATLDNGVADRDIAVMKKLLDAQLAKTGPTSIALDRYPAAKLPEMSLAGSISRQYAVDPASVSVDAISPGFEEFQASWLTDDISAENMILALREGIGIVGGAQYLPLNSGEQTSAPLIPVNINVQSADMFGPIDWNPAEGWVNDLPYPVKLKYLHALVVENSGQAVARVYTWSLDNARVPVGKRVRFDAADVPSTLSTKAERVWIQYDIDKECADCVNTMLDRSGVVRASRNSIKIIPTASLESLNIEEIWVYVRSKYFHPQDRSVQHAEVVEVSDFSRDYSIDPIFLVDRADGEDKPGDPLYEYRLEILTADGDILAREDVWTPNNRLRLPIGTNQIEASIGSVPGAEDDD